jgi:ATP-dependent DNA helicase RecG
MSPDPSELLALLGRGQGPEFHWFPEEVALARLAATLVGMANGNGGAVVLGVAPRSGEVQGVRDLPGAVDRVFQAALLTDPPLVLPVPMAYPVGTVRVLWISVPAGLPNVYSLDGRYLGREGTQTNPLPARRLRQLLLERGAVQFETRLAPEATLDDLDLLQIEAYLEALHLPGSAPWQEVLLRRGCLLPGPDGPLPTYAALLLFGRYPQQWLPNATLLAARFPGTALADQYVKQDLRGTLPEQLRQAETFLRDNLRSVVQMTGLAHAEIPEYPFEAVRELLVNAVAHRDYNNQGDNIHLHIFADRLEVHSPGGLPGPVTLENLLEARFSRNAVIVQALADLGFVERLGYGLDRVVTAMRTANRRPPYFEEIAGTFRATLYAPAPGQPGPSAPAPSELTAMAASMIPDLNPRQQRAIAYLLVHRRITNSEFQAQCPEVHAETLRRDLADLVTRGVIMKVGDKRATYYIMK